ncbi:DUF1254 domain-containing protein [Rhodoblastus sp.]|uniref:DUF1254 domain-containing protein n=1 Tax=Rhodoblastus sp. TaxID=1962975 RepID=UPI0025E40586|nr:DUF1254 domain-containing protein [Rhodoblastus sp.]
MRRASLCFALSVGSVLAAGAEQAQPPERSDPDNQLAYQRAIEAVIWSMPAISIREFWESQFKDYGASWNDIVLWSKPATPRHELLTANNQVPYMLTALNLRQGPVVVEIPAAGAKANLFGSFVDNWQAPIVDVGPSGTDEGRGGKYLFLPPGYTDPIPEGYLPVRSEGYVVVGGLRPVPANGGTAEEAHAYAQQMKVYPLADAAAPKPTRFIDGYPKPFHSLPTYDASWFRELAAMVNEEPVRERDKVMLGMLASIGIERGKKFEPDAKMQKTLDAAIVDARKIMQKFFETPGKALAPWWQGSQWSAFSPKTMGLANEFTYETADGLWLDARAGGLFYWATFVPKKLGGGTFYLMGLRDSSGQLFDGQATYRLRVPADVPAKDFWSAIVYDMETKAFVCAGPCDTADNGVGLSSFDKPNMKQNADGSVDVYFGPKAPAGFEKNWVPTAGRNFFLIFRLYGPEKAFFEKTWKLPEVEKVQ